MSKMSAFCISTSRSQASEIVGQLRAAGFFRNEISLLFPCKGTLPELAGEEPGSHSSGRREALLGWLAGTAPVPGIDSLIGAGPILAEFDKEPSVQGSEDLTLRLIGCGIPELTANHYDRRIRGGNILISTCTGSSTEIAVARDIFTQSKAENFCVAGGTGASSAPNSDATLAIRVQTQTA